MQWLLISLAKLRCAPIDTGPTMLPVDVYIRSDYESSLNICCNFDEPFESVSSDLWTVSDYTLIGSCEYRSLCCNECLNWANPFAGSEK